MKIFTCCLLLGLSLTALGQSSTERKTGWWINPNLGRFFNQDGAYGIVLSGGIQPNLDRRFVVMSRLLSMGELLPVNRPELRMRDFALQAGLRFGKLTVSTGVSYAWGTRRGAFQQSTSGGSEGPLNLYEPIHYRTIGLPFEAHWRFLSDHQLGMGIGLHGNVNGQQSYFGAQGGLYFGRLRRKK